MNIHVRVKSMETSKKGWKLVKLEYDGVLPDSLLWIPRNMDATMLADFLNDIQEVDDGHGPAEV